MLNTFLNSIISGLIMALPSFGFALAFRVVGIFHLAQAGIYAIAGISAVYGFGISNNWVLAVFISLLTTSFVTYIVSRFVYQPLEKKPSYPMSGLLSSIGANTILISTLIWIVGTEEYILITPLEDFFLKGDIEITTVQAVQAGIATAILISTGIILKVSGLGLCFRAVADNDRLARIYGQHSTRTRQYALLIGGILTAASSILYLLNTTLDAYGGISITLSASVVALLVSRLHLGYIALYSVGLALLQGVIERTLNAAWKDGLTFTLLLVVILLKTEGLVSYQLRKDAAS